MAETSVQNNENGPEVHVGLPTGESVPGPEGVVRIKHACLARRTGKLRETWDGVWEAGSRELSR